jgi:hypothetical protein
LGIVFTIGKIYRFAVLPVFSNPAFVSPFIPCDIDIETGNKD